LPSKQKYLKTNVALQLLRKNYINTNRMSIN
jgi:hypothetical protein